MLEKIVTGECPCLRGHRGERQRQKNLLPASPLHILAAPAWALDRQASRLGALSLAEMVRT